MIPDTINEFPSFSFLLGDLHAHVLALPFTVLALAFAMQVALLGPAQRPAVARGRGGAGRGPGDRDAVRDQLVVVSGRGGSPRRRGDHVDPRRGPARLPAGLAGAGAGRQLRADRPVRVELRPGGARDRLRARAAPVRQVAGRSRADLRDPDLAAAGGDRDPAARGAAHVALDRLGPRGRGRARLAAGLRRPDRRDARRGLDGGRHRRRALARAQRAGALPLDPDRRRRRAAADPRDPLPQGRVRRLGAVPHEHGLQGRLSGLPAARAGRRRARCRGPPPGCRGARGRRGRRSPRCC